MIEYSVVEDDGGGLLLFLWEIDYVAYAFSFQPEQLRMCLEDIKGGATLRDVAKWDGALDNPHGLFGAIGNGRVIAYGDVFGRETIYPERMVAGQKAFEHQRRSV